MNNNWDNILLSMRHYNMIFAALNKATRLIDTRHEIFNDLYSGDFDINFDLYNHLEEYESIFRKPWKLLDAVQKNPKGLGDNFPGS